MSKLNRTNQQIRLKRGSQVNINATGTVRMALAGEPHYTEDSQVIYVFNGAQNVQQGMRFTTGTVPPTTANIPNNGEFGFHIASGTVWLGYNLSGAIFKVQLT